MSRIVVVGGALAGIAAAARLARAGHAVTLLEARDALGGRLAVPGVWSPVLPFPAPLRDLLRKSGRAFDREFGTYGLRMVSAPPVRHVFADGTRFDWPTDRGEQWHLLNARYSSAVATRWRALVDTQDETWQALRGLGLEGELVDRAQLASRRRVLDPRRTVEDVARRLDHPHLADLVRDVARFVGSEPRDTPAWLLSRLAVERTFGRWVLVDDAGTVHPATAILDVLAGRLRTRGVRVLTGTPALRLRTGVVTTAAGEEHADAIISTVNPWTHARLAGGGDLRRRHALARLRPALAPTVSRTVTDEVAPAALVEEVRHTPDGPIRTIRRALPTGTEVIVHDFTRRTPTAGYGVRWQGPRTLLRLPPVRTPGQPRVFTASAASRGGNEPWAQLLAGALAVYAAHETLTGENIRPANRDYKP
nr:FAD-dependent oxidoreductase [Propionibacterium sp.]